ncbi:hypothetical protein RSK20926_17187 [Roseobacter sp. SK209-2-6]|uniref:hypothetical protein n=1 Tax=Roseobacter sp. SK209-2-6 TaxID=388739 RepID=UPI0000F3BFC8|nr:hypothetical protein [Roseobacter sp. SK209-2-6]EBA14952.1 hypothetical protein RSK20926_17187 [Roseobacter sp. SK209-2-6]
MTALKEFERLEAAGLWRADPQSQRRDVIVSIGDATLTITDMNDIPLAHWSLAAVERANPGQLPALFHPDGDTGETLEIPEGEETMLEAIDKVQGAIERARPHPGRLRLYSAMAGTVVLLAALIWGLPPLLQSHAVRVVPEIKVKAIGQALLGRIERVSGQVCATPEASPILAKLAERTDVRQVAIMPSGVATSLHLPGGIVLLNRSLVEDFEDPAVAAGAILAEKVRAEQNPPLAELLSSGGPLASFRLLTTGELNRETLDSYSERVLAHPRPAVSDEALLAAFAQAAIPSRPYGYAIDLTGETTLGLIEADPMAGRVLEPVLNDRDWVQLQNICS